MHILIAEDDDASARIAARVMEIAGYDVTTAHNGAEAWEIYNLKPVDVLVTDMQMPEMGGAELVRRVLASNPGLPVVVVSASEEMAQAVLVEHRGRRVSMVRKPACGSEILRAVERSLNG